MSTLAPQELVPISAHAFAEAMTQLVSGVTVVTARRASGQACGLLATSICSYSADPPSLLVVIGDGRGSHGALVGCAEFGVHLLGSQQGPMAKVFASSAADKFAEVAWRWDRETPRLAEVPVFLRCSRQAVLHHGDHTMIIGMIVDAELQGGEPMVYYRRRLSWRLC